MRKEIAVHIINAPLRKIDRDILCRNWKNKREKKKLWFVGMICYESASNYDSTRRSALPQPLTRSSNLVRQSLRAAPVSQAKNFGRCLRNAPLTARRIIVGCLFTLQKHLYEIFENQFFGKYMRFSVFSFYTEKISFQKPKQSFFTLFWLIFVRRVSI